MEEPIWVDEVKSSNFNLENLPDSIETQISEYLKMEEARDKNFDLQYVGEFMLWGKPIRCWDYENSKFYVTVQPYGALYYIGTTPKKAISEKT